MNLSDFDYHLPDELIARYPTEQRTASRLLALDKTNGEVLHHQFIDLIDELYDRKVNIFIVAKSVPDRLYRGTRLKEDFKRTASRLIEIQSSEYLALAHRP